MKKVLALLLIVLVIAMGVFIKRDGIGMNKTKEASLDYGWELMLVNDDYRVPEIYTPNLLTLSNGEQIDERIYPDLQRMFDDMRASGYRPMVVSGYRSEQEQERILKDKIQEYINQGYRRAEAEAMALDWVAQPGTSEHQIGIAVDINPDYTMSDGAGLYEWLEENAYNYGFIKRYPADKVGITGIANERWHYRYVGKETAVIMYEENLCLEEYIEKYCE